MQYVDVTGRAFDESDLCVYGDDLIPFKAEITDYLGLYVFVLMGFSLGGIDGKEAVSSSR